PLQPYRRTPLWHALALFARLSAEGAWIQRVLRGDPTMHRAELARSGLVAVALLFAGALVPAWADDADAKLGEQAKALNFVTGNDPIIGMVRGFAEEADVTNNLYDVAVNMVYE